MVSSGTQSGGGTSGAAPRARVEHVYDASKVADEKYLKGYFSNVSGNLVHAADDPMKLLTDLHAHLEFAKQNRATVFGAVFFESALPSVINHLVDRKYPEKAWMDASLAFVHEVIDAVVASLRDRTHTDKALQVLDPIVTRTSDLYTHHRMDAADDIKDAYRPDAPTPKRYATADPADPKACIYYAMMLNWFGEAGGFDAMLDRINFREKKIESSTLGHFVKFIETIRKDLSQPFLHAFVPAFYEAMMAHINALTAEERRHHHLEDLSEAINGMAVLLAQCRLEAQYRAIQAFKLELALEYVQLPILTASLSGIENIAHMLRVAKGDKEENSSFRRPKQSRSALNAQYAQFVELLSYPDLETAYPRNSSSGTATTSTTSGTVSTETAIILHPSASDEVAYGPGLPDDPRYANAGSSSSDKGKSEAAAETRTDEGMGRVITLEYMLQWIAQHDVIQLILKLEHPEKFKQGAHVIEFVARAHGLPDAVLDQIWTAAAKVHESIQIKMFDLISELINIIPTPQIDYLYAKITALDTDAYNNQVLNFISAFTRKAVKVRADRREDDAPLYGLDIFWTLLQKSAAGTGEERTSEAIVNETCAHLQKLLGDFPKHRELFLERCVENLRKGYNVGISLRLLTDIMNSYPSKDLATTIVRLDESYQLVNCILADIGRCAAYAPADREEAVRQRLSALEFILTQSELSMVEAQADLLWNNIMTVTLPNLAFEWFESVQYSSTTVDPYQSKQATRFPAFPPQVVEHLFTHHLANLDAKMFTPAGMNTYGKFFLAVNARQKKLRRLGEKGFKVRNFDLVGLDRFWNIVIQSEDAKVVNDALVFLRNVYANVSSKISWDVVCHERVAFTTKCCEYLLAQSARGDQADRESMRRCLWLLSEVVTEDNKKGISVRHGQASPTAAGMGPSRPRSVLSNDYFFALFGLLSRNDIRDAVWQLLMLVPTHTPLMLDMEACTKTADGRLTVSTKYEPTHPLFVYYNLYLAQVIEGTVKDEEWRRMFLAAGGLSFLISLFTSPHLLKKDADDYEYGKMAAGCLARVIHNLFTCGALGTAELARSLNAEFMHGLMDQISELASPQPPAASSSILQVTETVEAVKKKGDRIANCHYDTKKKLLRFNVTGAAHYQVAAYVVDYNTTRRVQTMVAFLGDDLALGEKPAGADMHPHGVINQGPDFHTGQWVIWEVHGEGAFNIVIDIVGSEGPNWVFSAFLLDKIANQTAEPNPYPTFVRIDAKTQGRWRGVYGSCGGVLLGKTDYTVPQRSRGPHTPTLGEWSSNGALRYEWVTSLTSDARAMQQVPSPDDIDIDEESEDEPIPIKAEAPKSSTPAGSTGAADGPDRTQSSQALLTMLTAAAEGNPALVDAVTSYPAFSQWLLKCLVSATDVGLRTGMVDVITKLCRLPPSGGVPAAAAIRSRLLAYLEKLDQARSDEAASFAQYFEILIALLRDTEAGAYDAEHLLRQLVTQLKNMPINEEDDDLEKVDTALEGRMKLISTIVSADNSLRTKAASREGYDLLNEVFGACLFSKPLEKNSPNYPKCKSVPAREAAFQLLCALASDGAQSDGLLDHLSSLLGGARLPGDEEFGLDISAKATEKKEKELRGRYTGLKNQGCTCYMNSALQQIFTVPPLREAILRVPLKEETEEDRLKNTMFQLQLLFAYMQERKSAWVDTIGFVKTVKMNGAPVNPSQQEDANEFLNTIVDQLEPYVKATPEEFMFRENLGGRLIHQVISKDCEHTSEREEDYLTISVKVQSKRNLKEAFDFYIQNDTLAGENAYNCEKCDKKVDAIKRCCIQHLPNTLAIHLIRFEFSFETFTNVKVYDYFEFPDELNMKPYTKEGLLEAEGRPVDPKEVRPDSYYQYELVGILVHSGSANAGHYYSYIREREPTPGQPASWFEFNDRRVDPFDPKNIPDMTFGGSYSGMSTGSKPYSAYMLFYDRKDRYKAREYDNASMPLHTPVEASSDSAILDKIWRDNVAQSHQRLFMQRPTFDFMWTVIQQQGMFDPVMELRDLTPEEDNTPAVRTIKFATRVIFDVLVHCQDSNDIEARFRHLQRLYEANVPCCKWLLERLADPKCGWLKNAVLMCPDQDVRSSAADLVGAAMCAVAPFEERFFIPQDPTSQAPTVIRVITEIISLLTQSAYKPARKTSQLLQCLLAFARLGLPERAYLISINAVGDLVSLYESQRASNVYAQPPAPNQKSQDQPLVDLLSLLSTTADNPCHRAFDNHPTIPAPTGLVLPPPGVTKLFDKRFLMSILRRKEHVDPLVLAIVHWCFCNREVSARVIEAAVTAIDQYMNEEQSQQNMMVVLRAVFELQDPDHEWRLEKILSEVVRKMTTTISLAKVRNAYLKLLLDLATLDPIVAGWLEADEAFRRNLETNAPYRKHVRETCFEKFKFCFPRLEEAANIPDPPPYSAVVQGSASVPRPAVSAARAAEYEDVRVNAVDTHPLVTVHQAVPGPVRATSSAPNSPPGDDPPPPYPARFPAETPSPDNPAAASQPSQPVAETPSDV